MNEKTTVLFICQHNAGRSQLGAALLEHLAGETFSVSSGGITPDTAVNPSVAATVAELGIDIAGRKPRAVTEADLELADIVVLMKPGLTLPAVPRGRIIEWSIPDPASWSIDDVRPMRDSVAERLRSEIVDRQQ